MTQMERGGEKGKYGGGQTMGKKNEVQKCNFHQQL